MNKILEREVKRERLLMTGVNLFILNGYAATGVQDILDEVSIPKGSFYNYFGSKELFAVEVVTYYTDANLKRLLRHLNTPGMSAAAALNDYYDESIDEQPDNRKTCACLLGILMGEVGINNKVLRQTLLISVKRCIEQLRSVMHRGQVDGSIRTDKSAETLARLFFDCWQGASLRVATEQSVQPLVQCTTDLFAEYSSN
jgi:TetR/AcrR family transcriptional repressor of nem operon